MTGLPLVSKIDPSGITRKVLASKVPRVLSNLIASTSAGTKVSTNTTSLSSGLELPPVKFSD